ncbi:hypothetical protein TNCV_3511121 [Trichonephila clavipes]|nr:hypothetical protein TNCV_3511121 [Trichonephila clavipes]
MLKISISGPGVPKGEMSVFVEHRPGQPISVTCDINKIRVDVMFQENRRIKQRNIALYLDISQECRISLKHYTTEKFASDNRSPFWEFLVVRKRKRPQYKVHNNTGNGFIDIYLAYSKEISDSTKQCFAANKVDLLNCPACSPSLNLIENVDFSSGELKEDIVRE